MHNIEHDRIDRTASFFASTLRLNKGQDLNALTHFKDLRTLSIKDGEVFLDPPNKKDSHAGYKAFQTKDGIRAIHRSEYKLKTEDRLGPYFNSSLDNRVKLGKLRSAKDLFGKNPFKISYLLQSNISKQNYAQLINSFLQEGDKKTAEEFAVNFLVNFPTEISEFSYIMEKLYTGMNGELNEKELLKAFTKNLKHFIHDPYILAELAIELEQRYKEGSIKINRFIEDALLKKADPDYKDKKGNEYAYHLLNFYKNLNWHKDSELISICLCCADAYPNDDDIMEFIYEIAEDLGLENYIESLLKSLQKKHPNAKALADCINAYKPV